jgi:hypothetical protein
MNEFSNFFLLPLLIPTSENFLHSALYILRNFL